MRLPSEHRFTLNLDTSAAHESIDALNRKVRKLKRRLAALHKQADDALRPNRTPDAIFIERNDGIGTCLTFVREHGERAVVVYSDEVRRKSGRFTEPRWQLIDPAATIVLGRLDKIEYYGHEDD